MSNSNRAAGHKPVLLTGITGFIAKQILIDLLGEGYRVRGTLRDLSRKSEVDRIIRNAGFDTDFVDYIEADLLSDKGWVEAVAGCDYVIHTASPFPLKRPNDRQALVKPAREGTLRVLTAAKKAGVKRVVLTSSSVSITEGKPFENGHIWTEDQWSDTDSQTIEAYPLSKTLAERAAWDFVAQEGAPELAVINPVFVMGPVLDSDLNTSAEVIKMFIQGKYPGVPDIQFGVVDVRNVSQAHIAAMSVEAAAGKRFICCSGTMTMIEIAEALRIGLPLENGGKLPKFVMPKPLLRIIALFDSALKTILPSVGKRANYDNQAARTILGIEFIAVKEAVVATGKSLIDRKLV